MLNASLVRVWRKAGATLAALACVTIAGPVAAEPTSVERFGAETWEQLQAKLPRPSVVVFTATYCSNCPAVLAQLADSLKERGIEGQVLAVVIDGEGTELLRSGHYDRATRLFAFSGNEAALRYRVDPSWRGVTPYVALLPKSGTATFVSGPPDEAQVSAWLEKR